jgi:hypothetical protein
VKDEIETRPRCLVFETMRSAANVGAGFSLAFGAMKNGRAVLYQERRNGDPTLRGRTLVTWEKVEHDQLKYELARAVEAGYDVNALAKLVEKLARLR